MAAVLPPALAVPDQGVLKCNNARSLALPLSKGGEESGG